jgi:hypothetical protein
VTHGRGGDQVARVAMLLQASDLARAGRPLPGGSPSQKQLGRMVHGEWLILSRAAKHLGTDAASLERQARTSPVLQVGRAEPPRLFGLFKRKAEPSVRWASRKDLAGSFDEDPVTLAEGARAHQALAVRVLPRASEVRSRSVPGKLRRPSGGHRYMPPTPSREALLMRADRSLVERYAMEETAWRGGADPPGPPSGSPTAIQRRTCHRPSDSW